ncbi:class I SAM-dependent methyltransferase [Azospirillum halopraeferens]|uniref:class I SAM-dependent methyltransferase n=1 Tax=Azospirillum halopraeferens TaxID=34010 RepID=UPI0004160084|nr:class I SAM-dependent methyltransferase [Azospirillum halopraeferens]
MANVEFISKIHKSTKRDYIGRVTEFDKAVAAELACKFDKDYWDGSRHTGYGGYRYDGRWGVVAEDMIRHYNLPEDARILDVGCGKGFLLYEFTRLLPNAQIVGIDISSYAIENAKEEVKPFLQVGDAAKLPFDDQSFDFVVSINTLHNLYLPDLWSAVSEIERVGKGNAKHIVVEGYRNEREKVNLMYWQLTCRAFHTPAEWEWLFAQRGYTGDWSFIYFE